MPSVRVKRSQYAHIDDIFPEGSQGRPRSQSVNHPNDKQVPRSPSLPMSGIARIPSAVLAVIPPNVAQRARFRITLWPLPYTPPRWLRPNLDRSEVISLQGSNENIIYHGDAQRLGRINSAFSTHEEDDENGEHHHDDIVEHLEVIDPAIATVTTLTNAANAIVFPPLSFYSRKPTIVLPEIPRNESSDAEKGNAHEDNLDRHVEDCLSKRDQWRRIMKGVWAFMKTPMGVNYRLILRFNVIFWGAGIVFFLGKLYNFHNQNTQDFWVEADLHYQQHKAMLSMTWYVHTDFNTSAFPIELALWICIMNDLNSFFQILLSACMWSMDRFQRPAWTTATTLPASFVSRRSLIWWGGKKSRRHEQVEQRLRAALAMEKPAITVTEPQDSDTPNLSESERLRDAGTGSSSPTISTQEAPRRKDFADTIPEEGSEYTHREKNPEEWSEEARFIRPSAPSFGSTQVPIADHMTVPPAEAVNERGFDSRSQ
ncbi:hypothetical protein BC629DRAFT_1595215 [Irpex lacteus]|nr:hypothetical protein BC629DRAFT_1595215 [Irpex lacteus]